MNEQHKEDPVLSLPASVPLPPDVHDRLRRRLFTQLREPDRARVRRGPLVVAAIVVLLAVGGALLTQSLHGGGRPPVGPASTVHQPAVPPLDSGVAKRDMDRCWSAIVAAHRTDGVPNRSTWRAVFGRQGTGQQEVVAVSAQGRQLFCETTLTSVTVSDPNARPAYAGGSRTAALLLTPDGAVAGVVDPSWREMVFTAVSPSGASSLEQVHIDHGMFIEFSMFPTGQGARFTARELDPGEPMEPAIPPGGESRPPSPGQPGTGESHVELTLPRPVAPLVAVVDRPAGPVDRTSANGLLLQRCVDKADSPVPDPASWQPGALVRSTGGTALVARNSSDYALCSVAPAQPGVPGGETYSFRVLSDGSTPADEPVKGVRFQMTSGLDADPAAVLVVGEVNSDVAKVVLVAPGRADMATAPVNGTFAFSTTRRTDILHPAPLTLRFLRADGSLIHESPVG
jgi:hypothetical protein